MTARTASPRRFLAPLVLIAAALAAGPGCQEDDPPADDDTSVREATPPVIEHTAIADGQVVGQDLEARCRVTDQEGVGSVTLFVRASGQSSFAARFFERTAEGSDEWVATIDAGTVTVAGVDYYIKATDIGSPRGESTWPEGAPEAFQTFTTRVVGGELPFEEDFEGEGSITDLGWTLYTAGFPYYDWDVADDQAFSGSRSAWHSDGVSGLAGPLQDWLISPPLSLVGATDVTVSWTEYGRYTDSYGRHSLLVSTGLGQPWVDGDFAVLADPLPVPGEGAWGASATYDLSAYAGSEVLYLAFYYEGTWPADRWWIDDVYVGPPRPRYQVGDTEIEPPDFGPGDAVSVTVWLENASDVGSGRVAATLATADPELTLLSDSASFDAIPAGASAPSSQPFVFEVDAAHPDNAYLDFVLSVAADAGIFEVPFTLRLGEGSVGTVTADAGDSGALTLRLGAGDPAAPVWETTAVATSNGTAWEVDLTPQAAWLPLGAGDHRWFLEATNDGLYAATVTGFEIDWGGVAEAAAGLPVVVPARGSTILRLPDPPSLVATAATVPDPVAPGASGVQVWVTLQNLGTLTSGALTGTLTSADPDATVAMAGPVGFGGSALGTGEAAIADAPFAIDVASDHRDDSDLALVLDVSDGVESFEVPVTVAVPWARPQIVLVVVDDGFTGDGSVDRGETVDLDVTVENVGASSTQGPVTVLVAPSASSEVPVTVFDGEATFGAAALAPGEAVPVSSAFRVEADGGYMGDALTFDVTLSDGADTWTQEVGLVLGDRPWTSISLASDAPLDANAYQFDLSGASYRSDGEVLWVRVESHTPFDPSSVFVDVHVTNAPVWWALEFVYEEWRLRDDRLYGDVVEPGLPLKGVVEDGSVSVRIALDDLGIIGHSTSLGFAAGACAYVWYCDVSPDDWFAFDSENGIIDFRSDSMVTVSW